MMRISKLFSLFLADVLVISSCSTAPADHVQDVSMDDGTITDNGSVNAEDLETEASGPADFVPDNVNYDGLTVRFMVCSAYYDDNSSEIAPLEEEYQPGEIIPEAITERNNRVYEKIGVEIESLPTEGRGNWSGYQNSLEKSVASGANDFDAICSAAYGAYHCAVQQLLVNLEAIDSLDLSHPWWSQRSRKSFDFGADTPIVYYINGDINYFDNWGSSCFLFNKNFLIDHGHDLPYDLVREYKWTFDAMSSMAANMYSDLDGNGKKKANDAFGVVANTGIMERYLPANGFDYIIRNERDEFVLNETEEFINAAETLFNYLRYDENVYLDNGGYSAIFYRGDAGFSEDNLSAIRRASAEMEDDYGVLPFPMWEESQQEYGCSVNEAWATVCGVTVTADKETVGLVMDVMGAYSPETVTKAVIDRGAMIRNARDEDTADMIRIIMDSAEFPFSLLVEWGGINMAFNSLLAAKREFDYASLAARMGKMVENEGQKALEVLRSPKA